jgi:hypothetical protein
MAAVKGYDPQIAPTGQLSSRADPNAFGFGVGRAMEDAGRSQFALAEGQQAIGAGLTRAGNAMTEVAQQLYARETQDEVTKVHQWMADSRANWQQKFVELENSTDPNDKTFVTRVQDVMKADYDEFKKSLTTRGANERADVMYSDMRGMFGNEAVATQSRLAGANIVNQNNDIVTKLSAVAGNSPGALDSAIQQLKVAIYDPASNYSHAPSTVRDKLFAEGSEKLKFAAAQGFIRSNPSAALEGLDPTVKNEVAKVAANPPAPGRPVDYHADGLAPLTEKQLSAYANKIDAPSAYDQDFKAAGAMYGVNWRELKMRAVVESGLQNLPPNAQNAAGVMQITGDTAKDWGINPLNPHQSIMAAARNLAKYQAQAGGDMSKVDMMYHGGANGEGTSNWGPKTRQYAANMAALRQSAGVLATNNPETMAGPDGPLDITHQGAAVKSVGNKIPGFAELPWNMQATLLVNAEHYQRAAQAQETRAKAEQARVSKDAQEAAMGDVIRRALDPQTYGQAPTEQEIAGMGLEPSQSTALVSFLTNREAAQNRADKDHPEKMVELITRIKDPDSENPINSLQPLLQAFNSHEISEAEFHRLEAQLDKRKEGGTTLTKKISQSFNLAHSAFTSEATDAYSAAEFTSRWSDAVEALVKSEQEAGRNPMDLFNPKNKNYVLSPEFMRSFSDPAEVQLANGAKRAMQSSQNGQPVADRGLKLNEEYRVNGKKAKYLGGPKNDLKSWDFSANDANGG